MLQSYQLNFLETSCIYSYCAKAFNLQAQIFANANDEKDLSLNGLKALKSNTFMSVAGFHANLQRKCWNKFTLQSYRQTTFSCLSP